MPCAGICEGREASCLSHGARKCLKHWTRESCLRVHYVLWLGNPEVAFILTRNCAKTAPMRLPYRYRERQGRMNGRRR